MNRFARDQPIELQEAIWKKCLYSISTKCKVLRAQKQNLGGIIYDDVYSELKVTGDLDLLANVTCPENQGEIHRAILEQSEHRGTENMPQESDMGAHGGDMISQEGNRVAQEGVMVQPEGDMVEQDGDIMDQEGSVAHHEDGVDEQDGDMVADANHITEDEVAMEHEQEVSATIQIDQSNDLCEQHIQVGEFV